MNQQIAATCGTLWELTDMSRVITLIGAGGKTTCLNRLAEELRGQTGETILTTTTKVYPISSVTEWCDAQLPPKPGERLTFWYAGVEEREGKWLGPARNVVESGIAQDQDYGTERFWLIEGDGARGQSLKCWADYEPQIPLNSQCAVLLYWGGLWGKTLTPNLVHRLELCPELIGKVWNEASFWQYLLHSPVFDEKYRHLSWVVLGNEFSEADAKGTWETRARLEKLAASRPQYMLNNSEITGPAHLRVAGGNAKEGKVQWFDL